MQVMFSVVRCFAGFTAHRDAVQQQMEGTPSDRGTEENVQGESMCTRNANVKHETTGRKKTLRIGEEHGDISRKQYHGSPGSVCEYSPVTHSRAWSQNRALLALANCIIIIIYRMAKFHCVGEKRNGLYIWTPLSACDNPLKSIL